MKGAEKLVSIYTNVQFSEVLLSSEWKFKVRCYVTNKWAIYKAQRAGCTVFWILASMFSCPYIWFLFNDRARIHWKIAFICLKRNLKLAFFLRTTYITYRIVIWPLPWLPGNQVSSSPYLSLFDHFLLWCSTAPWLENGLLPLSICLPIFALQATWIPSIII